MHADDLAALREKKATQRFDALVDDLEQLMRAQLVPAFEGYGGHVVLSREHTESFQTLNEGRKALRTAGQRLDWKVTTY